MYIEWRPQMSVDNGVIDEDHRTLIAIINAFIDLKYVRELSKFQQVLIKLEDYAICHFAREEDLQRTIRYPFMDAHSHEHKDLLKDLERMQMMFDNQGTPEEVEAAHEIVSSLLRGWLINHVLQSDLRMREAFFLRFGEKHIRTFDLAETAMTVSRAASHRKRRPDQQ